MIFAHKTRHISPCSIEKVKFENKIFQRYRSLNSHSAGRCSSENRFLIFDILMLLGDNYGVTIYKNSGITTAIPFSYKVSVEILDSVFYMVFTAKQAIVTAVNKDHYATSHRSKQFMPQNQLLNILAHFYQELQKLQKLKSAF